MFQEYNDTVLSVGLSHLPGNQGKNDKRSICADAFHGCAPNLTDLLWL